MADFAAFALALRAAREQAGLSQTELGAALGHTQAWCSRIEAGTRDPSLADLELLSYRFGLTLEAGRWHLPAVSTSGIAL